MDGIECYYKINDMIPSSSGHFPTGPCQPIESKDSPKVSFNSLLSLSSLYSDLPFPITVTNGTREGLRSGSDPSVKYNQGSNPSEGRSKVARPSVETRNSIVSFRNSVVAVVVWTGVYLARFTGSLGCYLCRG